MIKKLRLLLALTLYPLGSAIAYADNMPAPEALASSPVWQTENGAFRGTTEQGVYRLQGIRYASAERYAAPKPYTYPEGIVEATTAPPSAAQNISAAEAFIFPGYFAKTAQTEFPQFLNISLPTDIKPGEKLPVMVWIHGGAYVSGSISRKGYNPELIVSQHRVIVVSIAYRVGALGYLRNQAGELANLGLLDQIEGLKWVKRNISDFGGDSNNITLFGESAGGDAVSHLMIAEGTEGLFHRVIIQSAPFGVYTPSRAQMTQRLLREFNKLPIDASVEQILAKQAELIKRNKEKSLAKHMAFSPNYGVYPMPKAEELEEAWRKASDRLDVLVGATNREVSIYIGADKKLSKIAKLPIAKGLINKKIRKISDQVFIHTAKDFAQRNAPSAGRMYYYRVYWGENEGLIGAAHTIELSLLFGAKFYEDSPLLLGKSVDEVESYGKQLRQVWADFAKTGHISVTEIDRVMSIEALD